MRRTKEEAERTRNRILDAALVEFGRHGFASATLQAIARRAGVTRGAVYFHFENKADLHETLLRGLSAPLEQVVEEESAKGGRLVEVLRRIAIRQLSLVEEDPRFRAGMEMALFRSERSEELQGGLEERIREGKALLSGLAKALREGQRTGELREDLDPETAARALIAFQNGLVQLWLSSPESFSLAEDAGELADLFLRGIVAAD